MCYKVTKVSKKRQKQLGCCYETVLISFLPVIFTGGELHALRVGRHNSHYFQFVINLWYDSLHFSL